MTDMLTRFEAKVTPEPNTGCHLWTGTVNGKGYGRMWVEGRREGAHRVSWQLRRGPIPDGLFVCHKCDVRSCVNPDHLFLGTHAENMADAAAKGRMAGWVRAGNRNGNARLTPEQVLDIRVAAGTYQEIADRFGISQTHVSDIRNRKRWARL